MASPAKANGSERLSFDMEDSGSGVRAALVAGREEEEVTTTYASLLHGNRASQAAESGLRTSPSWGVTLNAITYMVSPHHTPPRARARHTDRHTQRERERESCVCAGSEASGATTQLHPRPPRLTQPCHRSSAFLALLPRSFDSLLA